MIGVVKLSSGSGHVCMAERPEPTPAAGQVLLTVNAAGVCGTDLHIEAGEYPSIPPVTLGHEISGEVLEVGPGVDAEWRGVRVVCETFFATCGHCRSCRDGRPNLCPDRRSLGTHVDGGFAPRVVVPAINLHRIPDWLADHAATLIEPLACVCQCMFEPSAVRPGDRVLVVGPGPMGALAAQVARALGGDVVVRGRSTDGGRLATLRELGFRTEDDSHGPNPPEVDVAIEASGSAAGAAACLEAVRGGGRFVQIGIFGRTVSLPLDLMLTKEIEVDTGFASTPRAWRQAMALIGRRDVMLDPLVSEVAPLSEWPRVFEDLRASRGMKIVLDPRLGWNGERAPRGTRPR